ncbi:hypothetical protein IAQ61_010119 [Plenodomus lingam]|uniref:Predicted protein n=1 Tax=Leptosphaeria maculans (strain JN3 / isolate v23.1.3 / race Av1-4-5-6-7-8) TaxID=985895 RepID=E5A302_LEPMJ|nr:predicted protein [Plenodomus lingam JN3]KAH9861918.1 hypothetical protein IAQ61_010119 [Plenodomus lingam]CBX98015.1 predicted protein [Plenodomus lingam JN3]
MLAYGTGSHATYTGTKNFAKNQGIHPFPPQKRLLRPYSTFHRTYMTSTVHAHDHSRMNPKHRTDMNVNALAAYRSPINRPSITHGLGTIPTSTIQSDALQMPLFRTAPGSMSRLESVQPGENGVVQRRAADLAYGLPTWLHRCSARPGMELV